MGAGHSYTNAEAVFIFNINNAYDNGDADAQTVTGYYLARYLSGTDTYKCRVGYYEPTAAIILQILNVSSVLAAVNLSYGSGNYFKFRIEGDVLTVWQSTNGTSWTQKLSTTSTAHQHAGDWYDVDASGVPMTETSLTDLGGGGAPAASAAPFYMISNQ